MSIGLLLRTKSGGQRRAAGGILRALQTVLVHSFGRCVARHGLTQAELARRVGTSRASIARLEADGVSPTIATLERILLAVGEELELSCVRRPLPRDDDAELMTEVGRPMAERLHSALVANDRATLMSGILADDPP